MSYSYVDSTLSRLVTNDFFTPNAVRLPEGPESVAEKIQNLDSLPMTAYKDNSSRDYWRSLTYGVAYHPVAFVHGSVGAVVNFSVGTALFTYSKLADNKETLARSYERIESAKIDAVHAAPYYAVALAIAAFVTAVSMPHVTRYAFSGGQVVMYKGMSEAAEAIMLLGSVPLELGAIFLSIRTVELFADDMSWKFDTMHRGWEERFFGDTGLLHSDGGYVRPAKEGVPSRNVEEVQKTYKKAARKLFLKELGQMYHLLLQRRGERLPNYHLDLISFEGLVQDIYNMKESFDRGNLEEEEMYSKIENIHGSRKITSYTSLLYHDPNEEERAFLKEQFTEDTLPEPHWWEQGARGRAGHGQRAHRAAPPEDRSIPGRPGKEWSRFIHSTDRAKINLGRAKPEAMTDAKFASYTALRERIISASHVREMLGLVSATVASVRTQFRRSSRIIHPDRLPAELKEEGSALFNALQLAKVEYAG